MPVVIGDDVVVDAPVVLLQDVLKEYELQSVQEELLGEESKDLAYRVSLDERAVRFGVGLQSDGLNGVVDLLVELFVRVVEAQLVVSVR